MSGSLGGTLGQSIGSPVEQEVMAGPVSLPRRAETFGGFDCHQMNASKGDPSIILLQHTVSSVPSVNVFRRVSDTQEFCENHVHYSSTELAMVRGLEHL